MWNGASFLRMDLQTPQEKINQCLLNTEQNIHFLREMHDSSALSFLVELQITIKLFVSHLALYTPS